MVEAANGVDWYSSRSHPGVTACCIVFRVVTEGVFVRRGLSPFAVLVFSVVVLVGFLVLVSVGSEAGPTSQVTVAPIVGAPLPEPPPIESFDSLSWSRVPDYPAIFGRWRVSMVSVAAAGPGLVAAGSGLWTSFDGITWDKVPYVEAFGTGEINSVTGGGPGLVAVGSGIWSFDGLTWNRRVESGLSHLFSVVAGGPGFVAVGEVGEGPSEHDEYWDADGAVWSSVDGTNWTRVPHDESVFGGVGRQSMSAVTVGGPGLVAVGEVSEYDRRDADAAVWTSVDGISWVRALHDQAVFGGDGAQMMNSVTAGGPGLVAVGSSEGDAAVWTSPDGVTWTRIPHDGSIFADSHMNSVTTAGPGVLAVGYTGAVRDAAVWTSLDGINWTRVAHNAAFEDGYMSGVTVGGPGLVVVGESGGSGAAVWVARSED